MRISSLADNAKSVYKWNGLIGRVSKNTEGFQIPLIVTSPELTKSTIAIFYSPPMVTWAQRPNLVFLTICLEDCDKPEIKVEADQLHFKGVGGPDKKPHEVTIKFFKEIDTEVGFLTSWCSWFLSDNHSIINSCEKCHSMWQVLKFSCVIHIIGLTVVMCNDSLSQRKQKKTRMYLWFYRNQSLPFVRVWSSLR